MLTFNQLLASSGIAAATELSVASLANPTELNAVGTAVPDWRLCHTTNAATDQATLYRLDADTDAVRAPYIMASATAGLNWVAVAGAYTYGNTFIGGNASNTTLTVSAPSTNNALLEFANGSIGRLYGLQGGSATWLFNDIQAASSPLVYTQGSLSASNFRFAGTLSASSSTTGALQIGNTLSATTVGIGGGNINAGGTLTVGGTATLNGITKVLDQGDFQINNQADQTKQIEFTAANQTTGTIVTLNTGAQTASRTISVPVLAGADTIATLAVANTLTAVNTFSNTTSATTSLLGAVVIGNGTAATSIGMGAGNINAGGTATVGQGLTVGTGLSVGASASVVASGGLYLSRSASAFIAMQTAGVTDYQLRTTATNTFGITDATGAIVMASVSGTTLANTVASFSGTTDASSSTVAANVMSGGLAVKKNTISAQGLGWGVTSTATAAGTTVLTTSTTVCQVFTGSTTQSVTLPAANAFGAGVAYVLRIKNVSTGTVTINRAGADTIDGGTSTTLTGGANQSVDLISNGVSAWYLT